MLILSEGEYLKLPLVTSHLLDANIDSLATDGHLNLVRPRGPPAIISETNGGSRPFCLLALALKMVKHHHEEGKSAGKEAIEQGDCTKGHSRVFKSPHSTSGTFRLRLR